MLRDPATPRGNLTTIEIASDALGNNLLGDPTTREVIVYTPHGLDGAGLPLLVDLVSYASSGLAQVNWKPFEENVPERLDRLIANGAMPPVAVAFPDCYTRLGGNQYINSAAMGNWEDFLIEEMLPAIETRFGCGGKGRRGVFGKSSGAYGTLVHAMRRADVWDAAAAHSGDAAFELCYYFEMPKVLRRLAKKGMSVKTFLADLAANPKPDDDDVIVLLILAMAATYDPDPQSYMGVRLPVDPETCALIEDRWARWLAWDPVLMADRPEVIANLKSLKGLWIECGTEDQFSLVHGARRIHRKLAAAGVAHVYEEFPDNHTGVDYRMDRSLPFLAKTLSA